MKIKRRKLLSLVLVLALVFANFSGIEVRAEGDGVPENQEIQTIELTMEQPTAGAELPTEATCNTEGINKDNVMVSWDSDDEKADYNKSYTVTIGLECEENHTIAESATAKVNSENASVVLNEDNSVSVTYTFTTEKAKLKEIPTPDLIEMPNGCSIGDIIAKLPKKITINTEDGDKDAKVEWITNGINYTQSEKSEQSFYVSGTVECPTEIDNSDNISLATSINIKVMAAATATATVTPNPALVYNGAAQELVTGSCTEGTLRYKVVKLEGNNEVSIGEEWKDSATATNAGSYKVYYYVEGDTTHNDCGSKENPMFVEVSISQKSIEDKEIKFENDNSTYEYTGEDITPKIKGLEGLEEDSDYEIEGQRSANEYGNYTITITGINNYTGKKTLNWNISDTVLPTATLTMGEWNWNNFNPDEKIILVAGEQTISVEAKDNESGIGNCYYYDSTEKVNDISKIAKEDWTPVDASNSITISELGSHYIYFKAVDKAGNQTLVATNQILLYQQSEIKENAISFTKKSTEDISINVTLNGNSIKEIKNADKTLALNTDYSIDETNGKIVLKNTYLSNLDASATPYKISVFYKPCGVDLAGKQTDGDLPKNTEISLTVSKNTGKISFVETMDTEYGTPWKEPNVTKNNEKGKLSYLFKKQGESSDKYIGNIPQDAGNYTVKITMQADENYSEAVLEKDFCITPKSIVVRPDNITKKANEDDPELTYQVEGLVNGDQLKDIILTRQPGNTAGTYEITASADKSANPNYNITFEKGIFTIEDAPVVPTSTPTLTPTPAPTAAPDMKISQSPVDVEGEYFVPVGKEVELQITVENADKANLEYQWYCDGKKVDGNSDKFTVKLKKKGTVIYTCDIYNKVTKETKKDAGSWKVTGYNEKVSITIKKTKKIKDILGKNVSLSEIKVPKSAKKALTVNAKNGTIKMKKYCKNAKVILVTKDGQSISITVTTAYPKPVLKVKKGALKTYIEGKYRTFIFSAANVKGSNKVVIEYSAKQNKGFKKAPQNKFIIKKGDSWYIRIYAKYGKQKSPYSKVVKIKG